MIMLIVVLLFMCVSLMGQVTRSEFVLLWATYLAIMYAGLEAGIGAGILLSTLYFAFAYARVTLTPLGKS